MLKETETIDPDSPLQELGQALLDAAEAYWKAYQKEWFRGGGAIVWLDDSRGNTVIFTRGEYRHRLLLNIEFPGPEKHFAHVTTDTEHEAEFESKTPDGFTG